MKVRSASRVTSTGREFEAGAAVGPALTTTPGDLATAKRKAEETGETDAQPKKRQHSGKPCVLGAGRRILKFRVCYG